MIPPLMAGEGPLPSDIQPVANETRDRIITGLVTLVPFIAIGLAGWQVWGKALHWSDVFLFLGMYVLTGLGITVGFHRHLTHRSFKAKRWLHGLLAILGSAAIEGPVISWVADHRKHHAFSDEVGDPHSPHVDHGHGWSGAMRGLFHAHMGWLFIHTQRGNKERFAPDLLKDPTIAWVDRTFLLWAIGGLLLPFALGWVIGGTLFAAVTGLLWGGLVRVFVLHHFTYSINSLCHVFGKRDYETTDESRNLALIAIPTFGEAWHNNHHAFPTSAVHGLGRWQPDPSGDTIGIHVTLADDQGHAAANEQTFAWLVAADPATHPALVRFLRTLAARDASVHTQRSYATSIAAYLDWLAARGVDWRSPTRADLRATEETLRRWLAAAALARPASAGGSVVVVADGALAPVQALLRFDPATLAERELEGRRELGFPPAVRIASLSGTPAGIEELLAAARLPESTDTLGPVPLPDEQQRVLLRVPRSDGMALAGALREATGVRSARKAPDSVGETAPIGLVLVMPNALGVNPFITSQKALG